MASLHARRAGGTGDVVCRRLHPQWMTGYAADVTKLPAAARR
ncbi:hypothetical protein SMD20_16320 [Nonomuraea sp. LP-02]|nr:hypothetical protein [Nonomuraea sp. LP-02]MED7925819.1 hypothetical protein [Nonomuraea sp. LP-02]